MRSACKFKTPHMQVFYNSGLKKGITEEERAVTYHDDLPSLLGMLKHAVVKMACYGSGNVCCLGPGPSSKVSPGTSAEA